VPGAGAVAGLVELGGAVCGLFLDVLPVVGAAVGFAAVLFRVPVFGVAGFAAAVPVPTPAGTHGMVVGDCGVVGVVGLGLVGTG